MRSLQVSIGFSIALFASGCKEPPPIAAGPAPLAYQMAYRCSDTLLQTGLNNDAYVIRADGTDHLVLRVDGSLYTEFVASEGEKETSFNSLSRTLRLAGVELPQCTVAETNPEGVQVEPVWVARGSNPDWQLTLAPAQASLVFDEGQQNISASAISVDKVPGGRRYRDRKARLTATAMDKICIDTETGRPYPDSVTLTLAENKFRGCGGSAHDVLAGEKWGVEKLYGFPVQDDTGSVWIAFRPELSQVGGYSGCNRFSGTYWISGEGIKFSRIFSNDAYCLGGRHDPMKVERAFSRALRETTDYSIDESGALVLLGPDGPLLIARR